IVQTGGLVGRRTSRGSGDGIDRAVLATRMGDAGAAVEAETTSRRRSQIGPAASGAGAIESRGGGTEEGFSRCRTISQAAGRSGTQTEFRTGCRAAIVADDHEAQAPIDAESSAVSEPPGVSVGGGAHQAVHLGFRPAG